MPNHKITLIDEMSNFGYRIVCSRYNNMSKIELETSTGYCQSWDLKIILGHVKFNSIESQDVTLMNCARFVEKIVNLDIVESKRLLTHMQRHLNTLVMLELDFVSNFHKLLKGNVYIEYKDLEMFVDLLDEYDVSVQWDKLNQHDFVRDLNVDELDFINEDLKIYLESKKTILLIFKGLAGLV